MPKSAVSILFGGDGNEHRVSVASARNVASVLTETSLWFWTRKGTIQAVRHDELAGFARPFEVDFHPDPLNEWDNLEAALDSDGVSSSVCFLALHGGSGENGTLQDLLEARGVAFTGSGAEASRLCFNKVRAREIVGARGIRVAEAILLGADSGEALHRFLQRTGRLVVKPVADGSSHGIWFVSQERELEEAVRAVRASKAPYIVERFIEGRELTVGVREQEGELSALPCSEVRLAPGRTFDFEGKYLGHGSEEITPRKSRRRRPQPRNKSRARPMRPRDAGATLERTSSSRATARYFSRSIRCPASPKLRLFHNNSKRLESRWRAFSNSN